MLHVKLYHSVDRILVKIAQVFLWFNPFVYLYARAIEENHEFEVDLAVSNSTDRNKYAELLFHLSVARQGTLYHNFSMVPLKKRIAMLFTKPTNRMKRIIYLLIVPVVLISCLAFARLKNEDSAKTKKQAKAELLDSTATVKYRQKTKRTAAQIKADDESMAKMQAYMASPEGKKKMALSGSVQGKVITVTVLGDYSNKEGRFTGKTVKEKSSGNEFLLLSWYGQEKQLNSQLNKGDEVNIKVFGGGVSQDRPVTITPAYVIKNGKEIFRLAEADKIPVYPFLYEANKVRFAEGQISNITKYPNGKWKTAVFERVNGYKFNLSFKPNAPDLRKIEEGDHVTLRFIHEVKTGDKTYNIKDWVAISTDIKDYGIKNPEWFNRFYEVVKTDTGKVSIIDGLERMGANPLVLIDGKEYSKDILYKISDRDLSGLSSFSANDGNGEYGEKGKDGVVVIKTRNGQINYLTKLERENLLKLAAAKGKFFSRVTLTKEDGSKYDMVRLHRTVGGTAGAWTPVNGKVAVIINGKLYNERDFKRLFPVDKASYGPSIGVSVGPTKDLKDRGFKVDGYNAIFEFSPGGTSKVTNTPVKTGAIAPGNNGINKTVMRKPALITGGSSDYFGRRVFGFTVGGIKKKTSSFSSSYGPKNPSSGVFQLKGSNNNPTDDTKKAGGETGQEGKDTVGNNSGALNRLIAKMPGMEVRSDGSMWVNNQPVKRVLINGKEYNVSQAINSLPTEIINKNATNTPRILVDGKEFIPTEIKDKVKVITNTPRILVDGKEFIPNNIDIDMKKDLLNNAPTLKTGYKNLNDSLVAASFSGTVISVQEILGTNLVAIKNGEVFAVYSNLKNLNVSKGQEVKKGQLLGVAAFNREENKVAAHLEFYRGSKMITDKAEQEAIIKGFEPPKLNMINSFKEMYTYNLPKPSKAL